MNNSVNFNKVRACASQCCTLGQGTINEGSCAVSADM